VEAHRPGGAEVQATFSRRAAAVPSGEFITTIGGFHSNQFTERRLPTLAELDAAVPHHPAYISIGFSGPSTSNTLGKAFFEHAALPVTVGADGSIATGEQTGRATLSLRQTLTFGVRMSLSTRRWRRRPMLVAAVMAAAWLLAACGGGGGGPATLNWVHLPRAVGQLPGRRGQLLRRLGRRLHHQAPGAAGGR